MHADTGTLLRVAYWLPACARCHCTASDDEDSFCYDGQSSLQANEFTFRGKHSVGIILLSLFKEGQFLNDRGDRG